MMTLLNLVRIDLAHYYPRFRRDDTRMPKRNQPVHPELVPHGGAIRRFAGTILILP